MINPEDAPNIGNPEFNARAGATVVGGGGTTTCDALWMGVPVVTLAGPTAVGRAGLSLLSNLGLPQLIARRPEEYLSIARDLAADLPRLAQLRRQLRPMMQALS